MLRRAAPRLAAALRASCSSSGGVSTSTPAAPASATAEAAVCVERRQQQQQRWRRPFSSSSSSPPPPPPISDEEVETEVNRINEEFAEAREEIEFAREDAETTYFNESAEEARGAVARVLDRWGGLLARVGEQEAAKLTRSMGLKMEQLKAELKELEELHA